MRDAAVHDLARRAGIAVDWRDYVNRPHRVSVETLRHVLAALGLPCETDEDLAHSRRCLDERAPPPLITTTVGEPVLLPVEGGALPRLRIEYQDESIAYLTAEQTADGVVLSPIDKVGYHHVEIGPRRLTLRCVTVSDIAPGERIWGLAAQIYGLHSPGDCGIGDMAGAVALGKTAARLKADALALSPTHALFAADPNHFSPYSPSSRLFYNPLHADAAAVFGEEPVAKARSEAAGGETNVLEDAPFIDWRRSSRIKMAIFRRLFDDFSVCDLSADPPTAQKDVLVGLQIGAPPDLYNTTGQNWGLTTFSPRALSTGGFSPFISTLRACMRHAGGVRIDHVMGLMRLWVVPQGAEASEGAYLAYPLDDLLRLTALESHRQQAVVIGEDLGTVPGGFRERLAAAGIYGMSVLWFERERTGFAPPRSWPIDVAAMTSTHDLPTVAGWWRGRDIKVRAQSGFVADLERDQAARAKDRRALWKAFRDAKVAPASKPPPSDQSARVDDAAIKFIGSTPSHLALLPLEDALALDDQPNLPGTIEQQPNWRRRYSGGAAELIEQPGVRERLQPLAERKEP